jgi:hypothetical protein
MNPPKLRSASLARVRRVPKKHTFDAVRIRCRLRDGAGRVQHAGAAAFVAGRPAHHAPSCRWVLQPADCSEPAAMTSGVRKAWAAVFQPKASEVKSRKRRTPAANE